MRDRGAAGNDRGGVPVDDVPWRSPGDLTAICVHHDYECVGVLIADEDHFPIGIDGRCNDAVLTVKGSERQLPSLFALEIVCDQAEISEEDEDVLSIGDRGRRRALIEGVLRFAPGSADRSTPLNLAGGAAQAHRNQVIALGSGEKYAIAGQNRGRLSDRQLGLPQNVLLRPKLGCQRPAGSAQAGAVRTTKLRPVGAEQSDREQRIEKGPHLSATHVKPPNIGSRFGLARERGGAASGAAGPAVLGAIATSHSGSRSASGWLTCMALPQKHLSKEMF